MATENTANKTTKTTTKFENNSRPPEKPPETPLNTRHAHELLYMLLAGCTLVCEDLVSYWLHSRLLSMDNILPNTSDHAEADLIRYYYSRSPRLKYEEISFIITEHHKIPLTIDRLKKAVSKLGLKRRKSPVDDGILDDIVSNEVSTSLSLIGYRQMKHVISRKYNIDISYERVRQSLLRIDPEGVDLRSRNVIRRRIYFSNGPFHMIHIDGHDKLKKWGFAIHGGIDGFSRKILWLKVATTNNDPIVVANYFFEFLKTYKTAPTLLRFDRGRENIYCEDMQTFSTKRQRSFIYASSVRNQRIEALWSRLVRYRIRWWVDLFHRMGMVGLYDAELPLHRELILFCFISAIQYELNEFLEIWNAKYVRKSAEAPGGKPNILFTFPQTVGFERKGVPISETDIRAMHDVLSINGPPTTRDDDVDEILSLYCILRNLNFPPRNAEDGIDLFVKLLEVLSVEGFNV